MKKGIVIGIILLFIGLAVAPSINASAVEDLVEIEVEFCGLDRDKHTVKLSKQQAEELEVLFDSIKTKLDSVETQEEATQVFNETVVKLDKYGLLGEMSVKQAQRMVTSGYQKSKFIQNLVMETNQSQDDTIDNRFCLLFGKATNCQSYSSVLIEIFDIFTYLTHLYPNFLPFLFIFIATYALLEFQDIFQMLIKGPRLPVFSVLAFGSTYVPQSESYPSKGWVYTAGLSGIKTWNDSFFGQIKELRLGISDYYIGASGFTGIMISNPFGSSQFLGSALRVAIGPNHPWI